jgi:hypothetical protein
MKTKLFYLFVLSVITLSFYSCQQNSESVEVEQYDSSSVDVSEVPDNAKYGMKSGVIQMESVTMGMKQDVIMYFDDWGNLMMNEIHMDFMGQKTHIVTIVKEGWTYQIDMIQKTGMKFKIDSASYDQINYMKMDEEMMKKNNMKYMGEVEILGRQCKEYEIDMKTENMLVTTAIWNGIAMRSEATMMGMKTIITVTDIQENVEIPAEKFEVPKDIKFSEVNEGPQSVTSITE